MRKAWETISLVVLTVMWVAIEIVELFFSTCKRLWKWFLSAFLIAVMVTCGGFDCAPSKDEWAAVNAMPDGPAKVAAQEKLEARKKSEESWLDTFGALGGLLGGFIPGAGLATAAAISARKARNEAAAHEEAGIGLTGGISVLMGMIPEAEKTKAKEWLKKQQKELGIREIVREYLVDEKK